jgi:hypothetical protein
MVPTVSHPDIGVKHCAYGNSVKPTWCYTAVFHMCSLTVARLATVVVAVPSTVRYPANYQIKMYYCISDEI